MKKKYPTDPDCKHSGADSNLQSWAQQTQSACLYTKSRNLLSKHKPIIFFLSSGYHVKNSKLHTLQFSYKISKQRAVTLSILQFSSSSMLIKH